MTKQIEERMKDLEDKVHKMASLIQMLQGEIEKLKQQTPEAQAARKQRQGQ